MWHALCLIIPTACQGSLCSCFSAPGPSIIFSVCYFCSMAHIQSHVVYLCNLLIKLCDHQIITNNLALHSPPNTNLKASKLGFTNQRMMSQWLHPSFKYSLCSYLGVQQSWTNHLRGILKPTIANNQLSAICLLYFLTHPFDA